MPWKETYKGDGEKRPGRNNLFIRLFFPFGILLILFFLLFQFFSQETPAIAVQHWSAPVFAEIGSDIRLIEVKLKPDNKLAESLGGKTKQ